VVRSINHRRFPGDHGAAFAPRHPCGSGELPALMRVIVIECFVFQVLPGCITDDVFDTHNLSPCSEADHSTGRLIWLFGQVQVYPLSSLLYRALNSRSSAASSSLKTVNSLLNPRGHIFMNFGYSVALLAVQVLFLVMFFSFRFCCAFLETNFIQQHHQVF
jgi:hypothetical protein